MVIVVAIPCCCTRIPRNFRKAGRRLVRACRIEARPERLRKFSMPWGAGSRRHTALRGCNSKAAKRRMFAGGFDLGPGLCASTIPANTPLELHHPDARENETDIVPSVVRSTLKSICFCAVVSPTVTDNNPLQVTARVAQFLEFVSNVSSNLYTAPCLAFCQIADFSASVVVLLTIAAAEFEFLTA